ncbi:hypothetical protein IMZ48_23080 [Candidatus Bathyarchaeota archaeon]|nr:hypothetical protein [Candidatus Bathyarchaeota archaeon]
MRASTLQGLLAFGSLASAFRVLKPADGVYRRQAFDPEEEIRPATHCTDFGPTYIQCVAAGLGNGQIGGVPLCIDPAAGETCCEDNKCMLPCPEVTYHPRQ